MTPVVAACVWALAANIVAFIPFGDGHRRAAIILLMTFLPLLVWVFAAAGPWWGLGVLAAGLSVMRYPVMFLLRRAGILKRKN